MQPQSKCSRQTDQLTGLNLQKASHAGRLSEHAASDRSRTESALVSSRLSLLRSVVGALEHAGITVVVFGGWAEELHGLIPRRVHRDIDLLLINPDGRVLDAFLDARAEIAAKRASHKRAFEVDGTVVELFIARNEDGQHVTYFWDHVRWVWPTDDGVSVAGVRLASLAALDAYRRSWEIIQNNRPQPG